MKSDAVIAFLPLDGFQSLYHLASQTAEDADMVYYVQFSEHCNIRRAIRDVREQFGLAGEQGYTILDIQLARHAADEDVSRIRLLAGDKAVFSDQRLSNQDSRGAFWAFSLFLYGFLTVIVLITCFHIVNSISMSASARMRQYGAMRAVGMSCGQFTKMLAAETGTYACSGCAVGCALGLPLHCLLYRYLVTARWGTPWEIPFRALALIVLVVLTASAAAILRPGRQIRRMDITEVIHSQ